MGDVETVEFDQTGVRTDQPGDHIEHRGLAGAVGAEQADRLAAANRQRDVLHHDARLEGAPQPTRDEPVLGAAQIRVRHSLAALHGAAERDSAEPPAESCRQPALRLKPIVPVQRDAVPSARQDRRYCPPDGVISVCTRPPSMRPCLA